MLAFTAAQEALRCSWEITAKGEVLRTGDVPLDLPPLGEQRIILPELADIQGESLYIRFLFTQKEDTPWGKAGDLVCFDQAELPSLPPKLWEAPQADGLLTVERSRKAITITGEGFRYVIDPYTGLPEGVQYNVWRAPTDNDRNIRLQWEANGKNYDKAQCFCRSTKAELVGGKVLVHVNAFVGINMAEPIIEMNLTYTFDDRIGVDCDAKFRSNLPHLPRFGFELKMPEGCEDVRYFGYGPYESYEDKRLASRMGLFRTTATENFEHYVRPQENSAHYNCKWADVTSVAGHGLYFSAEKFSLSVSHFSPEYLYKVMHDYELVPEKTTTVIVDYRNAGVGSNSCGPELLPQYRVSEKNISFSFSFSPEFTGNINPFARYSKI
jgi:beta-galactosidase